jgi:flagellar basal body-associated protein FliL
MKRANAIQEANYYVPIPEIVVNLRSVNTKGNILRTNLSLQVYHKEDEVKIKEFMPVILDQILSYLRDQSVGDLEGPGLDRMREAILLRINNIVRPIKIHRIVLRDFIIQ